MVTWVMGWNAGQLTRALGDPAGLRTFWDANIFFPERQALAFSEHFVGQTAMALPVYRVTGNPLIAYNIAFLATFVLTGLGTFLLARVLTGSVTAAAIAAWVAAFNEYRLTYEVAHLQVLSIHWFPFALYALVRYFASDRPRWLAAAGIALVALNLSSIDYMVYCAPFVLGFTIAWMVRSDRWRQGRVWLELWATAAGVALVTVPFLLPYLDAQQRLAIVRAPDEIARSSAPLDLYRAASTGLAVPLVLAAVAIVAAARRAADRSTVVPLVVLLLLAFWLSLGPVVQTGGMTLSWPGLYQVFYDHVPGFGGLRAPARFASLFLVFLALLAASGAAAIVRRWPGRAPVALSLCGLLLILGTPFGVPLDRPLPSEGLVPPPRYLTPAATLPPIYREADAIPAGAVLVEFPFGDAGYDLRYMYFSALHRRRLMNGYSGVFPPSYVARREILRQPLLDPPRASAAIYGATHAIVHRRAWSDTTGRLIGGWLESLGAQPLTEHDDAVLYELPAGERRASNHWVIG